MPNHLCWMCEAKTGHSLVAGPSFVDIREAQHADQFARGDHQLVCSAFQCAACHSMSIALSSLHQNNRTDVKTAVLRLRGEESQWRPEAGESRAYPDVPDHIAAAATEAYECHTRQHYRAAILLARSVIEATAKDKAVTEGNLKAKIDQLEKMGAVRPHVQAIAHKIRDYGNDMAHGDFVAPVVAEESQLVIQLTSQSVI